jgi:hypothetical protein
MRYLGRISVLPLIVVMGVSAAPQKGPALVHRGLCRAGEAMIFSCQAGQKFVSICASGNGKQGAQYRMGTAKRVELVYPDKGDPQGGLTQTNVAFSGGGEEQISFSKGGYRYVIFSATIRTSFRPDGRHDPQFTSGVIVKKGARIVSERMCTKPYDAPIDLDAAQAALPQGQFEDHR